MNTYITNGSAYYARTSSDEQKEKQTIQSQVSALEAAIEKNGKAVNGRYTDDGFSGAILDRPALDKLRADAEQTKFDTLRAGCLKHIWKTYLNYIRLTLQTA